MDNLTSGTPWPTCESTYAPSHRTRKIIVLPKISLQLHLPIFIFTILYYCSFEKMTSALYISEIVRLVILKCAEEKYLFDGETSEMLQRSLTFLPEFIYEIEG